MKRIVLFMVMVSMVCIASYAQKATEGTKVLVAYFSATGNTDTVYLGFPIWWNQAPRLINTFLEKYNLSGKTVIPFATSGSSSISNAESELRKAYPDVNWQKGKLMNGVTEEDIKNWTKK